MNETPLPQGYDARPADYDGQLFTDDQMRAHAERQTTRACAKIAFLAAERDRLRSEKATLVNNANLAFRAMQGQEETIVRLTAERDALQAKLVGPISEREKWLMAHALYAGDSYSELDEWLNDSADGIVTVEQALVERMAEVFATTIHATEGESA